VAAAIRIMSVTRVACAAVTASPSVDLIATNKRGRRIAIQCNAAASQWD
jgi:hypothetical protein